MGKLGRSACIFTPMVLSLASLLCLIVIFLGGQNAKDANLRSLYFFKADTTSFKANATLIANNTRGVNSEAQKLIEKLLPQVQSEKLKDFYYVYMWNYCTGTRSSHNQSAVKIDYCSPRKAKFYFDPITEWGINGTAVQNYVPKAVDGALDTYRKIAQWMFVVYTIAICATAASVVVGIFAVCSRIGSCITSVVAGSATLFTFLAAVTSTFLFSTLVGALGTVLKPYQLRFRVGTRMMGLEWLAVAFSLAASLFWVISVCCCSGRSSKKSLASQSTGYSGFGSRSTYQPLPDDQAIRGSTSAPYGSHAAQSSNLEMKSFGGSSAYKGRENAYEPFRQV